MLSSRQHSIEFQQTKFCIKFQINPIGNISIEYQIDLAKVITYRKKLHCRQLIYRLKKCIYYAGFVCFPQVRGIQTTFGEYMGCCPGQPMTCKSLIENVICHGRQQLRLRLKQWDQNLHEVAFQLLSYRKSKDYIFSNFSFQ